MQATLLPEAVTLYLDYVEAAGRSPLTLVRYRRVLLDVFARFPHPDPLDIQDFIESYPARNTRSTALVILRGFYLWAQERKILDVDPTAGIPIPKAVRRRWPLVTEEEFASVSPFLDHMMVVLATVLYRVGSRISETCAMRSEHVSFEGEYGIIDFPHRKGGDAGFAAFGPEVTVLLRPWIDDHPDWIFPLRTRPEKHIGSGQAGNELAEAGRKAGLNAPFVPHRLRHSMITASVDAGWSQLALQQQIGHRNPMSTAWYYKPTRQGLLRALQGARKNRPLGQDGERP